MSRVWICEGVMSRLVIESYVVLQCVAVCCSVLQCVAVRCMNESCFDLWRSHVSSSKCVIWGKSQIQWYCVKSETISPYMMRNSTLKEVWDTAPGIQRGNSTCEISDPHDFEEKVKFSQILNLTFSSKLWESEISHVLFPCCIPGAVSQTSFEVLFLKHLLRCSFSWYMDHGVALVSRIDKIIGLFCKRDL